MDLWQSTLNHVLRLQEYDSAISHNVSVLHYYMGQLRWNTEGWEDEANTLLLTFSPVYLQLSSPYEGRTLENQFHIAVPTGKGMELAKLKAWHSGHAKENRTLIGSVCLGNHL